MRPHWNRLCILMMYPQSDGRRLTTEDGDSSVVGLPPESHMDVYWEGILGPLGQVGL